MIGQQEFERAFARACTTCGIGVDHHAFGHRQRAADLQLRRLFDFHQAHAAGGLQRVAFVIAERRESRCRRALAASITSVPGAASSSRPSIVNLPDQPLESPTSLSRASRATHPNLPHTGTGLPFRCASKSSREFSTIEMVGIAAASPSAQNVRPSMFFESSPISAMSSLRPSPSWKRVQHLAQPGGAFAARDAPAAAFVRVKSHDAQRDLHHAGVFVHHHHAARTQHALRRSPAYRNPSAMSHSSAFSSGHDDPPGTTAFSFLPLRMPPPTSSIICITGEAQRQFVNARLVHVAGKADQPRAAVLGRAQIARTPAPPSRMIAGTAQKVSTLFRAWDIGTRPTTAGNGGLMRGMPRLPSSESSSADSSPHSYAPAPECV